MLLAIMGVVMLPFLGTVLGAAGVFFLGNAMRHRVQRSLTGFAAGIMTAASVWSLMIPALEQSGHLGKLAFLPAFAGVWSGFLILLLLDHRIPHLHMNSLLPEGTRVSLGRSAMLVLAVTLHNLPEGMAVGVAAAGWLAGNESVSAPEALVLALGIALQNLPEGAIISMPLHSGGMSRGRAFGCGVLSGLVEPMGALLPLLLAHLVAPVLPVLLCFAAGAMLYVVVEELIPEMSGEPHSDVGTICFAAGFSLMMVLDTALG